MTLIEGIIGSIIAAGIVALIVAGYRRWFGEQIKITHPRSQETLTEAELVTGGVYFPIRGTLRRLPKGHEIWLLTQNDSTGSSWPQGFFPVQFDPERGTWMGKINGSGSKHIRIVAVVAPPTSQDFFRYFQHVGQLREYKFEPLKRVPPECKHHDSVQVRVP